MLRSSQGANTTSPGNVCGSPEKMVLGAEPYSYLVFIINLNFRNAATCHLKFTGFIRLASTKQCARNLSFRECVTTEPPQKGMVVLSFLQCNKSGYQAVSYVMRYKEVTFVTFLEIRFILTLYEGRWTRFAFQYPLWYLSLNNLWATHYDVFL